MKQNQQDVCVCVCVCVCINKEQEIYYKDVIMETEKFQDLYLASCRPRRANSDFPARVQRPEEKERQWCKFQFKTLQS